LLHHKLQGSGFIGFLSFYPSSAAAWEYGPNLSKALCNKLNDLLVVNHCLAVNIIATGGLKGN